MCTYFTVSLHERIHERKLEPMTVSQHLGSSHINPSALRAAELKREIQSHAFLFYMLYMILKSPVSFPADCSE